VVRGGTAEALEMVEQVSAETKMPCRATWIDDPLFSAPGHHTVAVEGQRAPVLLFEPQRIIAVKDPVTGQPHELRVDSMVAAGWQRVPPRYIMTGLPAEGWALYRTAAGVELCDPYGCIVAEGRLTLDPQWVSDAVSLGSVLVLFGPRLGIRVPPGRSPRSYTDQERAREFRDGRQAGLVAAASVAWHTSPPEETLMWVLLREGAFGLDLPPLAYVPLLNLKPSGGPHALGFASLDRFGRGPLEIPVTAQLAARITGTDVDLIPADEPVGGFAAGYRTPGGTADPMFPGWRAAAVRYGRILVITGAVDLMPDGEQTSPSHVIDVIRRSHGALVPLTADSAPAGLSPQPQPESPGDDGEQAEYSELLTAKLRSQESYEVYIADTVGRLIDRDTVHSWLTNLWPVACQTCGEPLGTKADLCADPPGDTSVMLSLHHSSCRASGATPPATAMVRPTASFAAGYLPATPGQPSIRDFPVMVINPSCEQLLLERDATGGWRNATLDEFIALGFRPPDGDLPPHVPRFRAALDGDQLTVTINPDTPDGHTWTLTPPPHVRDLLRRRRGLAISVTTKALPTLLIPADLPGAFGDPEAVTGFTIIAKPPRHRRRPALHLPWPRTPSSPPPAATSHDPAGNAV
jgi:hypothetical protein